MSSCMNVKNEVYEAELKKDRYEALYLSLMRYEERGIRIRVMGNYFPIQKCAEIMSVNEGECYMPDYTEDSCGRIVEINYDMVARN